MKTAFIERLQHAREIAERLDSSVVFSILSGFRCTDHNKRVGGSPTSSHTVGWAADIITRNHRYRFVIIQSLLQAGFTRIGVNKTTVHVDSDPDKDPQVIWHYYK